MQASKTDTMRNSKNKIENFANTYPSDANSWSQATDEIKDVALFLRMQYNETNTKGIRLGNGITPRTPSEWNRKYKSIITICCNALPDSDLSDCVDLFSFIK